MTDRFQTILTPFSRCTDLKWMISISGRKTVFPLYHVVSDNDLPHLKHIQYIRDENIFERDLETFLKYFKPVSLNDYLTGIRKSNEQYMVLSFDDGLKECYDVIAPILKRKGIPAVFFLNNQFIDNKGLFYRYKVSLLLEHCLLQEENRIKIGELLQIDVRYVTKALVQINYNQRAILDELAEATGFSFDDYLRETPVYMNSQQVNDLIDDGFEIGSHSFDHLNFAQLPLETTREQILDSIKDLNMRFGLKKKLFSFPFSSDGVPLQLVNELLTGDKVDALLGTSGLKSYPHPGFIQRIPMEKSNHSALQILKMEYLYYLMKAPFGKNRYMGG